MPDPVQPTPEALLRRAEALGLDIKLTVDPVTNRLAWDNSHDLTMAVDSLAVYRATGVIRPREERAGRLYAMGRRSTFGGVYPMSTVLAQLVASSLPQNDEQAADWAGWEMLTDEEREERRERLEANYREADRRLLRVCGPMTRAVVRVVCLDGEKLPVRAEGVLVHGLAFLADYWRMEDGE